MMLKYYFVPFRLAFLFFAFNIQLFAFAPNLCARINFLNQTSIPPSIANRQYSFYLNFQISTWDLCLSASLLCCCLCASISVWLFVFSRLRSVFLSAFLYLSLVCLSVYLSVCRSVCLPVCFFLFLSVRIFFVHLLFSAKLEYASPHAALSTNWVSSAGFNSPASGTRHLLVNTSWRESTFVNWNL